MAAMAAMARDAGQMKDFEESMRRNADAPGFSQGEKR
jgi:hypothetical protein